MVNIDLKSLPEEDQFLAAYLSEDSDDGDMDIITQKCAEIEPLVKLNKTFPLTIIVAGTPIITQDKVERLKNFMQKRIPMDLSSKGLTLPPFTIELPLNDKNETKGIAFFTFSRAEDARKAAKYLNGFAFDAKHTLATSQIDKLDDMLKQDDTYRPPDNLLGFTRENFRYWLTDEKCREQFVIRYANSTEIFWHDQFESEPEMITNKPPTASEGTIWTDLRVQWSPQGSYLITFHIPGIALWAEKNFEKKIRFGHDMVKHFDMSPNENYILTWDGTSPNEPNVEDPVRLWKVISGERIANFRTPKMSPYGPSSTFPLFLWSHDDAYLASIINDNLHIYELPSMAPIFDDKTSRSGQKFNLSRFDWSPSNNIISIWIPETANAPGRLLLLEVPSLKELASKNIYNVHGDSSSMHWQAKGDYLALKTLVAKKMGKKAKKIITQVEILRIREKKIPVDSLHIENAFVKQLHWEEGDSKRFALVVEDEKQQTSINFYKILDGQDFSKVVMVESFDIPRPFNFMKWSPQGTHFILASKHSEVNVKAPDNSLLFCALNDNDKVEVLHKDEHFMVNTIKWSSCGRYIATISSMPMFATTAWKHTHEHGYTIWNFQGRKMYSMTYNEFYQFLWRPHPPTLLSQKKVDEIKKTLSHYSKRFDAADEKTKNQQREQIIKTRKKLSDEFDSILSELEFWKTNHDQYEEWVRATSEFEASFEWELEVIRQEEEIEVIEEVIGKA